MTHILTVYDNIFGGNINCCDGTVRWDVHQEKMNQAYSIIYEDLNKFYNRTVRDQVFGDNKSCSFKILDLIHHFIFYLDIIDKKRKEYVDINGSDRINQYYIDQYCTECIRKAFYCLGISTEKLLQIYELYNIMPDTEESAEVTNDGIGYMVIDGDTDPINRVRKT